MPEVLVQTNYNEVKEELFPAAGRSFIKLRASMDWDFKRFKLNKNNKKKARGLWFFVWIRLFVPLHYYYAFTTSGFLTFF